MEENNIVVIAKDLSRFPIKGIQEFANVSNDTIESFNTDMYMRESNDVFDLNNYKSKCKLEMRLKEIMFLFLKDKEEATSLLYKWDESENKIKNEEHINLCNKNIKIIQDFLEKHNLK